MAKFYRDVNAPYARQVQRLEVYASILQTLNELSSSILIGPIGELEFAELEFASGRVASGAADEVVYPGSDPTRSPGGAWGMEGKRDARERKRFLL